MTCVFVMPCGDIPEYKGFIWKSLLYTKSPSQKNVKKTSQGRISGLPFLCPGVLCSKVGDEIMGLLNLSLRLPVIGNGPAGIPSQLCQLQTVQTYREILTDRSSPTVIAKFTE